LRFEVFMQKSRLPLLILILVLGCVLCLCAAVTGVAVYSAIRSMTDLDLPQIQALVPPDRRSDPGTPAVRTAANLAIVNRIVVAGEDGNLYTIGPDGTGKVALTEGSTDLRLFRQPAWSPDASRVAWVEIEVSENGLNSALVTSAGDGGELTRADTADRPPFYLAWSPDSNRVAALSSWDRGLALRTVDVASGGANTRLIGRGEPLYFAWSPDGQRLLAHLNGEKVSMLSADGKETELDASSAPFGAPDWMSDGAALVYAQRSGGSHKLVLADPSGVGLREIARVEGAATFSVSPDGSRVAFVDTGEVVPTAALGPLAVAGLEGSDPPVIVDKGPVLAFFWSPQGDKIAYLTPGDKPADGPSASLAPTLQANHLNLWLQWKVWDGQSAYELSQFRPSDTFLVDYLRFFDQYARSMTPWAPDGSAFVYAGDSEDGVSGVWVHGVEEGSSPQRIGDGVYAAWSPR
jgi:TolB protein